jgi:hypothetical protein
MPSDGKPEHELPFTPEGRKAFAANKPTFGITQGGVGAHQRSDARLRPAGLSAHRPAQRASRADPSDRDAGRDPVSIQQEVALDLDGWPEAAEQSRSAGVGHQRLAAAGSAVLGLLRRPMDG